MVGEVVLGYAGGWKGKKMVQVDVLRLPSLGEHHALNFSASSLGITELGLSCSFQGKAWDGIEPRVVPKWPQCCAGGGKS